MRITCGSVEAFIQNVQQGQLFEDTVWYDRTTKNLGELSQQITLQLSAVVIRGEAEYLLQCGEVCGVDLLDEPRESEGTAAYERRMKQLKDLKCVLLPGVIHE